jgi:gliding motility-associated-like protein
MFNSFSFKSGIFCAALLALPNINPVFATGGGTQKLEIISPPKAVCVGETFRLKATGGSDYSYEWSPAAVLNNPNSDEPSATIYDNTRFRVIRSKIVGEQRDTAFVDVLVLRKAFAIDAPEFICRGIQHTLSVDPKLVNPVWNTGHTGHQLTIQRGGYYSFKAQQGCHLVEGNVFIRDLDKPIAKILAAGISDICEGQSLELNAVSLENPEWSTGSNAPSIKVNTSGKVSLFNTNECGTTSDAIQINVHKVTAAYLPEKWEDVAPYKHIIYNQSEHATHFEWYLNDKKISMERQPVLYLPEAGNYRLRLLAVDQFGCKDEVSYSPISVLLENAPLNPDEAIIIPNAFSPNGDGLNDELRIYGQGIKRIDATVFDRWGGIVFEFKGPEEGWKGTDLNGQLLPQDLYTLKYSFVLEDGTSGSRTMQVSLLR